MQGTVRNDEDPPGIVQQRGHRIPYGPSKLGARHAVRLQRLVGGRVRLGLGGLRPPASDLAIDRRGGSERDGERSCPRRWPDEREIARHVFRIGRSDLQPVVGDEADQRRALRESGQ